MMITNMMIRSVVVLMLSLLDWLGAARVWRLQLLLILQSSIYRLDSLLEPNKLKPALVGHAMFERPCQRLC